MLKLDRWVRENYHLDGWWAAYQFDSAVTFFGSWVESRLAEMEKIEEGGGRVHYEPRYRLADLLTDPEDDKHSPTTSSDGGKAFAAWLRSLG